MAIIQPEDFTAFADIPSAKLAEMILDAEAMASLAAPCLLEPEFLADASRVQQVKAVLRSAILRWNEAGSGASVHTVSGPFQTTMDTRQPRRAMFWPSELSQLRDICAQFKNVGKKVAFAIDTAPSTPVAGVHAVDCSLVFGALYCSCGSDLNRGEGPLWGGVTK